MERRSPSIDKQPRCKPGNDLFIEKISGDEQAAELAHEQEVDRSPADKIRGLVLIKYCSSASDSSICQLDERIVNN